MPDTQRLKRDISEVEAMKNVKVEEKDPTNYIIWVKVEDGLYKNHWFRFNFEITPDWPMSQPKVTILDKIWHFNIRPVECGGQVCVSTLTNDGYTPTVTLSFIVESLKFLLVNPNEKDPLNIDAAQQYNKDPEEFKKKVNEYLEEMKQ